MREISRADLREVLETTGDAFEQLRGGRLLVTGGTGFFGHWLLESLLFAVDALRLDIKVVLLTRDSLAFRQAFGRLADHPALTLLQGDVRRFDPGRETFTHVVHGATSSAPRTGVAEAPLETISVIFDGTRRVLEVGRDTGARRLLFVSSGAVYGRLPSDRERVTEDFGGAPDSLSVNDAYGNAKRLAEQLCVQFHAAGGPEPVIARPFAFAAPFLPLDAHFAVGNFIRDVLSGRPLRVHGDGTARRSYMYGSDLAAWLWRMLVSGEPGRSYNVGSEESISVGELAARIGRRYGLPVELGSAPRDGAPSERYVPDTARARRELGLGLLVGLEPAIDRTVRWHRDNRQDQPGGS